MTHYQTKQLHDGVLSGVLSIFLFSALLLMLFGIWLTSFMNSTHSLDCVTHHIISVWPFKIKAVEIPQHCPMPPVRHGTVEKLCLALLNAQGLLEAISFFNRGSVCCSGHHWNYSALISIKETHQTFLKSKKWKEQVAWSICSDQWTNLIGSSRTSLTWWRSFCGIWIQSQIWCFS